MTEVSTATIQQWFAEVTAHQQGLRQGLISAWHQYALSADQLIKPGHLGIERRLAIYANGYTARLLECLKADYPSLNHMLGDELFDTFARAYIMENPSTSYTLFDLGAGFAKFLHKTKPDDPDLPEAMLEQLMLPIEVARLERARVETIRCKGHESQRPTAANFDLLMLDDCQLVLSNTAQLLSFNFEIVGFMRQLDRREEIPAINATPTHVALWRHQYAVHMQSIELWQFEFLQQCRQPDALLDHARAMAEKSDRSLSELLAQLYVWLPLTLQSGLLIKG